VPIPLDRVDAAELRKPHPWDMRFIRDFMLVFGPLSSLFDFITFYVLLAGFGFQAAAFRTAWFVESIATQVLVIFVIRTRHSAFASRPHPALALTSLGVVLLAALLPYTAFGALFALVPLPAGYFVALVLIALAYLALAEYTKHWFYRRVANRTGARSRRSALGA
jgi:Mg2+-importing ATPase